ncbi:MAG: asparaginase [Oscillospiraceae bacterium]|nr:asparaginase [Oscillospiraceae bacterium]
MSVDGYSGAMPKILVIGTGGTISCAKSENGLEPALSVSELLRGVEIPMEIHTEQPFNLDSTNMTSRHWETLARLVRVRYDEFDGFVILHGTDTMAYAAASLSCLIQNPRKPIVFTGSMKPMTVEYSDAPINLRDAVRFAADERAFGVRLVFDGAIIDGRCAHKYETENIDSFDSVNNDDYGFFNTDGEICFFEEYSGETRFYEHMSDDVFLVKLIPGQKLCVPSNVRALILESYGMGGIPDYLMEDVAKLAESGVYVIVATQCAYGGTNLGEYAVGHVDFPIIEVGKYTVEYAVARARWALAKSHNYQKFTDLFRGASNI